MPVAMITRSVIRITRIILLIVMITIDIIILTVNALDMITTTIVHIVVITGLSHPQLSGRAVEDLPRRPALNPSLVCQPASSGLLLKNLNQATLIWYRGI